MFLVLNAWSTGPSCLAKHGGSSTCGNSWSCIWFTELVVHELLLSILHNAFNLGVITDRWSSRLASILGCFHWLGSFNMLLVSMHLLCHGINTAAVIIEILRIAETRSIGRRLFHHLGLPALHHHIATVLRVLLRNLLRVYWGQLRAWGGHSGRAIVRSGV